jgi:hypothetical protein
MQFPNSLGKLIYEKDKFHNELRVIKEPFVPEKFV